MSNALSSSTATRTSSMSWTLKSRSARIAAAVARATRRYRKSARMASRMGGRASGSRRVGSGHVGSILVDVDVRSE